MYKRIAAITDIDSFRDVQDELINRYGEIPRSVQNLLDIALYKSRAAQLGILNFTVHPEEVRFFRRRCSVGRRKAVCRCRNN